MSPFLEQPGLLFVAATLLPLASFLILLIGGGIRSFMRTSREASFGANVYSLLGGPTPGRVAAYIATAAIGIAFLLSLTGFVILLRDSHHHDEAHGAEKQDHGDAKEKDKDKEVHKVHKWAGSIPWARIKMPGAADPAVGTTLYVGFKIDTLAAVMFVMVTFIATLIHLFSAGYMSDELKEQVEDHQVHTDHGHLHRRGRFGRFFLYLSLFCFSMLNLLLADNLFQVFVSWELVGVCSFLLIGFYYERHSASTAANKAFITNRVGDAGFIIGLMIVWTYLGTFNFEEIFSRVRAP